MGAIPVHHTATSDNAWDAGAAKKRLKEGESKDYYRKEFAFEKDGTDGTNKSDYGYPHHEVSESGDIQAANVKACQSAIAALNGARGAGSSLSATDRKGVYDHVRAHLEDAGEKNIPDLKASAEVPNCTEMQFDASGTASVLPSTANTNDRTVDVVWYTGVSVPRINQRTGDPYNLRLDMSGARLGRLNAGAPVFDNHQSGSGFSAMISGVSGTRAQIGVVDKAWADGTSGKATLRFAKDDPNADALWNKVASGIIQNLSFGTWIYDMEPDATNRTPLDDEEGEADGPQNFVATDWEPFEISPVCVPADFNTAFLGAQVATPVQVTPVVVSTTAPDAPQTIHLSPQTVVIQTTTTPVSQEPEIMRASAREENTPVMEQTTQAAGAEARTEQLAAPAVPAVNTDAIRDEAIKAERERATSIRLKAQPFAAQLEEKFVNGLIDEGLSVDVAQTRILEKLAATADKFKTQGETGVAAVTRDQRDTRVQNMEAALLYKSDSRLHAEKRDRAREYVGFSLIDMAKECLEAAGIKTRGIPRQEIARLALNGRDATGEYFSTIGAAGTSDFPNILANVANKSLRMAYEAYPSSFKPFCKQVSATDFKPLNRVQLSDIVALQPINESGEYSRTTPSDSKETYSLATFGEIVAITRRTIINDDLQAFTRVPAALGVAAGTLEANTVWAIFTGNPNMSDGNAVFSSAHSNSLSGAGSALGTTGLGSARASMRLQTAPKGTPLNLTPRFLVLPAALETTADQLVAPLNIASTDFSKVVPQWIRSLQPIVEPRLDANSTTAWYLVADPAMIEGIEYAYLEGQEGVYTETRQGFDVDGLEIKARMDFAAACVEYRGVQKNAGA